MEIVDIVPPMLKNNVIVTTVDALFKWAHGNSIWPLSSGLACCAIEMMSAAGGRLDMRFFGPVRGRQIFSLLPEPSHGR